MQDTTAPQRLEAGTEGYRRANLAMFVAGFACFAMLYGTQPLLPMLVDYFGVSPATASLSVSAGTIALAAMLIPASLLSDRFGRQRVMRWSLIAAAVFATLSAVVTDFAQLLVLRGLLGMAIAGVPAAAMAYLGEEIAPNAQGRAMGLYIAGNAFGGMSGRFLTAWVTDHFDWQTGLLVLGALGAIAALAFWFGLPASRHFQRRSISPAKVLADAKNLMRDAGLPWLFLSAFLLMGGFVGLYNFVTFRLVAAPFSLGQTAIGGIFLLYMVGTLASAWVGQLVDRIGRRQVLWMMAALMLLGVLVTLPTHLGAVIVGIAIFTFGFFGAHTTTSGWVSRRAGASRALAAAVYLSSYYLGSSVLGTAVGLAWDAGQWIGVVSSLSLLLIGVLAIALHLTRLPRIVNA